jgi:hypothetical protein
MNILNTLQSAIADDTNVEDAVTDLTQSESVQTTTDANTVSSSDGEDDGADSGDDDDVEEPAENAFLTALAAALSNQLISSAIRLVAKSLQKVTSSEEVRSQWARADASRGDSDREGIDVLKDDGIDTSVSDNSRRYLIASFVQQSGVTVEGLLRTSGRDMQDIPA